MRISDVFVIMPFTKQTLILQKGKSRKYPKKHFDELYDIIKDAVREHRKSIQVDRSDDRKSGNILSHVIRRVQDADLVIAVLTAKNANVFWELGIRHALKKGTMMLLAQRDEVPFDLDGYFSHEYSIENNSDIKAAKKFIRERLKEYESDVEIEDSPVLDILQRTEYDQFRAWNVIERRRAVLILRGLIREYQAVSGVIQEATSDAKKYFDDASFVPRTIDFSFSMLDGFVRTRPLVGLDDDAYVDATVIFGKSNEFQEEVWNVFVDDIRTETDRTVKKAERKARVRQVQGAGGFLLIEMNMFATDLIEAMNHVLVHKDAWQIPWGNSMDTREDKRTFTVSELAKMQESLTAQADEMFANLKKFQGEIGRATIEGSH